MFLKKSILVFGATLKQITVVTLKFDRLFILEFSIHHNIFQIF